MTPKTLPDSAAFPDPAPGQEARSAPEVPCVFASIAQARVLLALFF